MLNYNGVVSILLGLALVSISSLGLVGRARFRGIVSNLLAFAIIAYATIVLLIEILSELHAVHRSGLLVGHALVAVALLPWATTWGWVRLRSFVARCASQKIAWRGWVASNPGLTLLALFVSVFMLLGAVLILAVPPNDWDSLWYHLSRVAHWLQHGSLRHFPAAHARQTAFAIDAEIGLLWLTALWGSDQLAGFLQWSATVFTMVGLYGIARQLRFSRQASLFAALIWSSFTIVVVQSTSTKNDIVVAFFMASALYFVLDGLRDPDQRYSRSFIWFGLALGLALGTKFNAWLALPGLALAGLLLIAYRPRRFWPRLLYAAGCGLVGFGLLGSYNYALNRLHYGALFGPAELVADHNISAPSPLSVKANLGRATYQFINPGGLPDSWVDSIQQSRSALGQRFFTLLDIPPNPPDTNMRWTDFSFEEKGQIGTRIDKAWYGPLGFLLFLPGLLFYLLIFPFIQRDIWKWLTALLSLSYILLLLALSRWQPYLGRLLLVGITLGAPLMAGFYLWSERYNFLRWAVVGVALIVMSWSATHNYHKPALGPGAVWQADYYDLRAFQARNAPRIFRYLDATLPPESRLGLAVTEPADIWWWDYLFFGPGLTREVTYFDSLPEAIQNNLFVDHNIDYLIVGADTPDAIRSAAPLWPVGPAFDREWFLIKRSDMELFTARPRQVDRYRRAFGADYQTYLEIKTIIDAESRPCLILTTDPKMPYYDLDSRFVFAIPKNIEDLAGFEYLVTTPLWQPQDYARLGISPEEIAEANRFLSHGKYFEKVYETNGYALYHILF